MTALPAPIHYSDAQVLTVRRLTDVWSDAAIAAYLEFPNEGHVRLSREAFAPKEVACMRDLARSGWTCPQIAAYMEAPLRRVSNAVSGRAYAYFPGAVKKEPRSFKKYQVVFMRYLYREKNWTQLAIAAYFEAPGTVISAIVSGRSYKDIHGAVQKPQGSVPKKDVLRMRALYARKKITQKEIAEKFGVSRGMVNAILAGRLYAHLPGALVKRNQKRRFTDEQVLFMRILYQGGLSLKTIGDAYKADPATINHIVVGKRYAEVPEATPLRPSGFKRRLTNEQVDQARRMYRTRYVFGKQIARELGIGDAVYKIIRGEAYKELPGSVPMHIKAIRRGIVLGPKRKPQGPSGASSSDFVEAMEVAD